MYISYTYFFKLSYLTIVIIILQNIIDYCFWVFIIHKINKTKNLFTDRCDLKADQKALLFIRYTMKQPAVSLIYTSGFDWSTDTL